MDKIKCPHCGAMNQDVGANDKCWQCDKPLNAPVEVAIAPEPEPVVAPVPTQVQKQVTKQPVNSFPIILIIIVVLAVIIIGSLVLRR